MQQFISDSPWDHDALMAQVAGEEPRARLLIVRREADGTHKYSMSNASEQISWKRLGYM